MGALGELPNYIAYSKHFPGYHTPRNQTFFLKLKGFMQKLKQKCRAKPFCVKAILLRFEARFVNRQVCSWVEEPYHKDVLLSLKLFIMFGESEKRQHVLAFFPRWEKLLQSKSIFSKHHWRSASLFRVQTDQKGICLYPFYWPVREVLNWKWLCQRLSSKNGKI